MVKLIKKMFANVDTVLKKLCVFSFVCGLIAEIIFFGISIATWFDDDFARLMLLILLGCNIGILFLYAFCDILTQLKLLNEKNK